MRSARKEERWQRRLCQRVQGRRSAVIVFWLLDRRRQTSGRPHASGAVAAPSFYRSKFVNATLTGVCSSTTRGALCISRREELRFVACLVVVVAHCSLGPSCGESRSFRVWVLVPRASDKRGGRGGSRTGGVGFAPPLSLGCMFERRAKVPSVRRSARSGPPRRFPWRCRKFHRPRRNASLNE